MKPGGTTTAAHVGEGAHPEVGIANGRGCTFRKCTGRRRTDRAPLLLPFRERLYAEILKKKKEMARLIKEKEAARAARQTTRAPSGDPHHHRDTRKG